MIRMKTIRDYGKLRHNWINGIGGWIDGWTDRQTNRQTDRQIDRERDISSPIPKTLEVLLKRRQRDYKSQKNWMMLRTQCFLDTAGKLYS